MLHPNNGDRVHVKPRQAGLRVQRGAGLYNQCLPDEGMECTWDDFLMSRLIEGAIVWGPIVVDPPVSDEGVK